MDKEEEKTNGWTVLLTVWMTRKTTETMTEKKKHGKNKWIKKRGKIRNGWMEGWLDRQIVNLNDWTDGWLTGFLIG